MISVDSRILGTVLVAAAAFVAAACGSDSGSGGGGDPFWSDSYNPSGAPTAYTTPTQHTAAMHPGNCLNGACHTATGTAQLKLAWGGVVYQASGTTRAPNVQVGVASGTYKKFVYSRSDGLYWVESTATDGSVDWNNADIRIRNVAGEKKKAMSDDRGADCDSCHMESGGTALPLRTL